MTDQTKAVAKREPTSDLVLNIDWGKPTRAAVDLLKNVLCPVGTTDLELSMFLHLARKYDLDPVTREIMMIERREKIQGENGEWRWNTKRMPTVGKDGFLKNASRCPEYDGFEVEVFYGKDGTILTGGAICKVYRKDRRLPVVARCLFTEYMASKDGQPVALWRTKPETMIIKCAKSQAHREAFPMAGLYAEEELEGGGVFQTTDPKPTREVVEAPALLGIKPVEAPQDAPRPQEAILADMARDTATPPPEAPEPATAPLADPSEQTPEEFEEEMQEFCHTNNLIVKGVLSKLKRESFAAIQPEFRQTTREIVAGFADQKRKAVK